MSARNEVDELRQFFAQLWTGYVAITPDAERVHALLDSRGETFGNDHVALRTFDDPRLGVERLAEPFCARGYTESGSYRFARKRLRARSFAHASGELPRVFISELDVGSFSDRFREIIASRVATVSDRPVEQLLTSAPSWDPIDYDDYRALLAESEYGAWVATFGVRVNHFTVHFNDLKSFGELSQLNSFLEQQGFELNGEGSKIQGSPAALLEQSSTVARPIRWTFAHGEQHPVPGGYYEFAKRYPDPATGRLFEGFVTASADKIFESTDVRRA